MTKLCDEQRTAKCKRQRVLVGVLSEGHGAQQRKQVRLVGKQVADFIGGQVRAGVGVREHGSHDELARRRIDQLSGGQMCRVVLAGLLARRPRVLILDEPLAGVDAPNQRKLVRLLEDLRRDTGLTVVVISHDFVGLEGLCPRILHLSGGVLEPASASAEGVS